MVANHSLSKFADFVVFGLRLGELGDLDFVVAFAVHAVGDFLVARRCSLTALKRLDGLANDPGSNRWLARLRWDRLSLNGTSRLNRLAGLNRLSGRDLPLTYLASLSLAGGLGSLIVAGGIL